MRAVEEEEGKKCEEAKEKTKEERKTATIDWSCCRLASLGRLTLLLRLFGSEREKMRTPIDVFCCSCLHILLRVYMRRRAFRSLKYQQQQQAMQLDHERIEGEEETEKHEGKKNESNILMRILNNNVLSSSSLLL